MDVIIRREIVGHIMFTKIKVGKDIALALAPLSVLPKMQAALVFKLHLM